MGTVRIRALLASGYGALERLLRDCERMSFQVEHLRLQRIDDVAMDLDACLGNVPASTIASLASRLERHIGVMNVVAVGKDESVRETASHEPA